MLSIAVFASGGGSDLQSVIDAIECGYITEAKIRLVISGKADAYALQRAQNHGIEGLVFSKKDYSDTDVMFECVDNALKDRGVNFIVLAGYLTVLPASFVEKYEGRIINIHPSRIPKFCGDGFYGMRVHEAVIAAGEKISGATVHFVDAGTDTGTVILQSKVPVLSDDSPESLQKRVLESEHKLLPYVVKLMSEGRVTVSDGEAVIKD